MSTTTSPTPVTEIGLPWKHPFGTVVAVEYPADRPMVVDLVLSSGNRTAETRTALYTQKPNGLWDLARFVTPPAADIVAWNRAEDDYCEAGTLGCSVRHTIAPAADCQPW